MAGKLLTIVDVLLEGDVVADIDRALERDGVVVAEGLDDVEAPVQGREKMETGWIPVDPVA